MRETGPVRKELSGEEAAPYIGFARTALGQLKNQMEMGGLQQGKMTRRLPDGTVVVAQSVFGQDKISIEKPVVAEESATVTEVLAQPHEEPVIEQPVYTPQYDEITVSQVAVCGTCTDDDGSVLRAWVWSPGAGVTEILGPSSSTRAHAISGNGQIVVGSFTNGLGAEEPYMWTKDGGMVSLGRLSAADFGFAAATDVNHDGSIIVGAMAGSDFSGLLALRDWVWTAETGMVELSGSYTEFSLRMPCPVISPKGKFIAGTYAADVPTHSFVSGGTNPNYVVLNPPGSSITPGGMLWERVGDGWVSSVIPPGTAYHQHFETTASGLPGVSIQFLDTTPFQVIPGAVSDLGVVAGTAFCATIVPLGESPINVTDPGVTPLPIMDGSVGQSSTFPSGVQASVAGITTNGRRTAGAFSGLVNPAQGTPTPPSWVYTQATGLVAFNDAGAVLAMSPDGTHFCGGNALLPMYWSASGGTEIPLLPGATQGWATDLSVSSMTLSTDPQAVSLISSI